MSQIRRILAIVNAAAFTSLLAACAPQEPAAVASGTESPFNVTLDIPELMRSVVEPASDVLWDNAGWIESAAGYEELYPTSDDGWAQVRAQAAVVAESGNLLMLPGRALDNDAWIIYSQGMVDAGLMAMKAAEERNKEDFFQAGAQLYSVCTACHQGYNPEILNKFVQEGGL